MQNNNITLLLVLIFIFNGQSIQLCPKLSTNIRIFSLVINQTRCYTIEQCHLIISSTNSDFNHLITFQRRNNSQSQLLFSSKYPLWITYQPSNATILFSSILSNKEQINLSTTDCYATSTLVKRHIRATHRLGSTSSIVITFNSSSFIDYRHEHIIDYPIRLSIRFRTLGRISNGVILSLTHRTSSSIIPFIILDHANGKIELTILKLDERNALSPISTIQCGKNVNNDHWHFLQFEIDQTGMFTLVVDDDSQTSHVSSYIVSSWKINALLVGDTRRFNADIFKPFIGYMSDLMFNDENLFTSLTQRKGQMKSSFYHSNQHIIMGYRIAFFNLVTFDTQTSYIAVAERESQNKNHGKLDIYFLFRSYVPDGLILHRYAQGLNEYFAIGLRAGILALFIDFGFGKRLIVSDESTKLADGKWHEVRVTRIGTDKIELIVDNRVNRSTLSGNGIRNAVSLQPVLYVGGIPTSNNTHLKDAGFNSYGFQGCLASFIVDGHLLDYQTALVLQGQVKMNVCSDHSDLASNTNDDLNKLCYDFTCIHSGICTSNDHDGPICDCRESGYIGERCDKLPNGFYFGRSHSIGLLTYVMNQSRQTEHDTITFGLQTLAMSVQLFRLESDIKSYSLEYEIIQRRSYIKLNLGEQQANVYSAITHITDGMYHSIKVIRTNAQIQLYVDGIRIEFEENIRRVSESRTFLAQRRVLVGSFVNALKWNGIIAGFTFNRQPIFETFIRMGDVEEVYPDQYTGQFHLTDSSSNDFNMSFMNFTFETTTSPIGDHFYHTERITLVSPMTIEKRGRIFQWFFKQTTRFGSRSLLIGLVIASCFLSFLLFIIIRLHCTNRPSAGSKFTRRYTQSNGRTYSQLHHQNKRYSIAPPDGRASKKRVPKFLRYLHTNEAKPTSFRLSTNGGDSYHLISSIQDTKVLPYRNSDCVLNEHCCIHSSLSQPTPTSPSTIYHEVNRLMLSGSDPPLPLSNIAQSHAHAAATLRSLKKEIDNSSAQTYSAVYSCDLAANLDIEQDIVPRRSSMKRRSILKNTHSSLIQSKIVFLYVKNLVDCYALQPNHRINNEPILLATGDENRIQLSHALTGSFHSQLPISSPGSCHNLFFSSNGQFLIGLFYEITTNVNPYAVKIWSTEDYSIRTNLHPIKCSIAVASRQSSILYMAGKQKYGRGISLGLLDIDSCSLARELKSDPDTSIGDEIQRIILTKNETYALVACTEHTSSYTCFVVFKLETMTSEQALSNSTSMTNCTMILTRFDSDPHNTFSINDDQQILTILRTNQILIWKLNDGEILFNYDFHHLNFDNKIQSILNCRMKNNRLLILVEQGLVHVWDVTLIMDQFSLISTIADPLIHSISWLDSRHFLSIDIDNQRIRIWNIYRKDVINDFLSTQGTFQSLSVHLITSDSTKRQEYLIMAKSINERNLLIFEYTQPYDEQIDSSNIAVC